MYLWRRCDLPKLHSMQLPRRWRRARFQQVQAGPCHAVSSVFTLGKACGSARPNLGAVMVLRVVLCIHVMLYYVYRFGIIGITSFGKLRHFVHSMHPASSTWRVGCDWLPLYLLKANIRILCLDLASLLGCRTTEAVQLQLLHFIAQRFV